MTRILLTTLIITLWLPFRGWGQGQGQAQEEATSKAAAAMRRLAEKYQQARLLSFDVLYRYAAEGKPGEYLDSLRGQCKVHGNRYWSALDNTESVYDGQLLVMLFKEDSIIYLAKPAAASMPGAQGGAANPVAMIDTFLLHNKGSQCFYTATPGEELITLSLPGTGPYKQITWQVNRKTGYLDKMTSLVRSDQLYDPSVRAQVTDAASSYVVVETLYSNFRQGAYEESIFAPGRYAKKEGDTWVTVVPYEKYKVFLGSTGL
ncbi:hypothetical protein HB364_16215 [Pseudoflavitalea sp. X16]|uniref:hypothetical protein n=1 Tax=Paraflavitalea devenefica TaxID=2716334 RepID=UPI0014241D6C|nr:hypothetical protein [Paraflavitalea devenefica]NII26635.1 hypothetical protein [Paraflavitalea devenefica]